jgi:hypothetical protein
MADEKALLGLGDEAGSGRETSSGQPVLALHAAWPGTAQLTQQKVPFAPSGLAAGSLKRLDGSSEEPSTRLLGDAGEAGGLVMVMAPLPSKVHVQAKESSFSLCVDGDVHEFAVSPDGRNVLELRP